MKNNPLVLVLNCGSSSLKGALLDMVTKEVLLTCLGEKLGQPDAVITFKADGKKQTQALSQGTDHTAAVMALLDEMRSKQLDDGIAAVGHRFVHGGEHFSASTLIDEEVMKELQACAVLAPLHTPANIEGIRAAQKAFPALPQVAVFDTAFHQSMPDHAYRYAVPGRLYRDYGVRRYGAHGTSYRYVTGETARMLGKKPEELRLVIAHLGNGASITAVRHGKSQDTSMGLTPLEGLVMGTRSGDIDPSIFPFLQKNAAMDIDGIARMLNNESGLLGLSELSNDCRVLEEAAEKGHEGAKLALAVFVYRLAKYVGSMAVAAGGIDALVFTGGIGENSAPIREEVLGYLGFMGFEIDSERNHVACFGAAGIITPEGKTPLAMVVPTNEELMIATDTAQLAGLHV